MKISKSSANRFIYFKPTARSKEFECWRLKRILLMKFQYAMIQTTFVWLLQTINAKMKIENPNSLYNSSWNWLFFQTFLLFFESQKSDSFVTHLVFLYKQLINIQLVSQLFNNYFSWKVVRMSTQTYIPKKILNRKFNFSDISLAMIVREKLYSIMRSYTTFNEGKLDQQQIKNFLAEIMKKSQIQLKYAVKNALRYDDDRDNLITLDELVDFCVEQQFGSTAIQHFHKENGYSQGSKRIINEQQFIKTLNYCFNFLDVISKQQMISSIFKQIDINSKGFISYEDYFKFLKEFFGKQSQASTKINNYNKQSSNQTKFQTTNSQVKFQLVDQKTKSDQKQVTIALTPKSQSHYSLQFSKLDHSNIYQLPGQAQSSNLEERIAKMIYTQLKLIIFRYDSNKNLFLQDAQVKKILTQQFKMNKSEIDDFIEVYLTGQKVANYQLFLREVLPYYLCELIPKWNSGNNRYLQLSKFGDEMQKYLSFMKAKPLHCDLINLFNKYDQDKDGKMSNNDYKSMIRRMLKSYSFIGYYNSQISKSRQIQ